MRPECGSHLDSSLSFTAHRQVISKPHGTSTTQKPTTSSTSATPALPPSSLNAAIGLSRLSQRMSLSCSKLPGAFLSCSEGVGYEGIATRLETHPSILDFKLLGQAPPKPPFPGSAASLLGSASRGRRREAAPLGAASGDSRFSWLVFCGVSLSGCRPQSGTLAPLPLPGPCSSFL